MLNYHPSPLPLMRQLATLEHLVVLDSAQAQGPKRRYDIISGAPVKWWQWQADQLSGSDELAISLDALPQWLHTQQLPKDPQCQLPFNGGLMGLLRYSNALMGVNGRTSRQPVLEVGLYEWAIVSDHERQCSELYFHPLATRATRERVTQLLSQPAPPPPASFKLTSDWQANWRRQDYQDAFERVQAYLKSGDCYQINLTQSFSATYQGDLITAYERLRASVGSPFSGYFAGTQTILSVSPERLLRVNERRQVEARPIKGTRPRAANAQQDHANAQALLASEKDRAENVMIVDLLRNDLGKVAAPGSVNVPVLFGLESYPNVHHMVSVVQATLAETVTPLACLFSASPGGSITGAPKYRAMEIIDELEADDRSAYCGSLFYYSANGRLDASILIRTMEAGENQIRVNGGGGVVYDSQAEDEYQESLAKIRRLMQALQ